MNSAEAKVNRTHGPSSSAPRAAALAAVLGLLAGCAAAPPPPPAAAPPPAAGVFVLLPNTDGSTGRIIVANPAGERTLSLPRESVGVAGLAVAPGEPRVLGEDELLAVFGTVLVALPRPPEHFILHFKPDSSDLTEEAAARLKEIVQVIQRRPANDVSVVGHADTRGDREYNFRLSLKRAEATAALLREMGVPADLLDV